MLKRTALLAACFLCCVALFPQDADIHKTGTLDNGRRWKTLDLLAKVAWVSGYNDGVRTGLVWAQVTDEARTDTANKLLPVLTVEVATDALDRFYAVPKNERVPISMALTVIVARMNGATEEFLEGMTERYREAARESK